MIVLNREAYSTELLEDIRKQIVEQLSALGNQTMAQEFENQATFLEEFIKVVIPTNPELH
jgi:hypothetical protein